MNLIKSMKLNEKKEKVGTCKGKLFRGKVNAFVNNEGEYVYQERMRPLKRASCEGCLECGWLNEALEETVLSKDIPIINNIKHGATYRLQIVNVSRDYATGIIDDWKLEFVKVN